jgi:hypothetical protein
VRFCTVEARHVRHCSRVNLSMHDLSSNMTMTDSSSSGQAVLSRLECLNEVSCLVGTLMHTSLVVNRCNDLNIKTGQNVVITSG